LLHGTLQKVAKKWHFNLKKWQKVANCQNNVFRPKKLKNDPFLLFFKNTRKFQQFY